MYSSFTRQLVIDDKLLVDDKRITVRPKPVFSDGRKRRTTKLVDKNRAKLEALHLLDSAQHANQILLSTPVSRVYMYYLLLPSSARRRHLKSLYPR